MRIRGRMLLFGALAAVLFSTVGEAALERQVRIRLPDPYAPLSPVGTRAEFEAFRQIQDEKDPLLRLLLVTDFEGRYADSEYRHLVLRLRWQAISQREGDPEDTIEAARDALAAQDHFVNGKMSLISNPESMDELSPVLYDLTNQKALYYGSIVDAYVALGDSEGASLNSELGLAAVDEAWDLYVQDDEEGTSEFEHERQIRDRRRLNFLEILVPAYQRSGDVEKVIEYGQQFLEVAPDDLEMLLYLSSLMAQRPPQNDSLGEHLATTEGYATRAVERLGEFLDGSGSSLGDSQKASLQSGAQLTLGLVYAQLGKLEGAVEALARAVTLEPSRQVRTILENVYLAKNGSLDGLDAYIQGEGARGESGTARRGEDPQERAQSVAGSVVRAGEGGSDGSVAKAAKDGDLARVRKLIESGANVDAASADGSTALLWAAYNFDTEMARVLLEARAQADVPNNYGVTPLLQASRTGDAAMVELLLSAGADPERTHVDGETPLMAASRSGSLPTVRLLVDRGVDVNQADTFQNQTALMWASAEGHVDVVEALLEAGADPDRQARTTSITERKNADHPTGGFTALMWAARNGDEEIVRRLVEGGADLDLKNGDGASATMIAIYNDRFDMAAKLFDLGADVNDGSLYTAVEMRMSTTDQFAFDGTRLRPNHPNRLTALDLVELLLERGADPHQWFAGQFHSMSMPNKDRFNSTPFLRAAEASDAEALKVFVAHVSDPDKVPVPPGGLWCHDVITGLIAVSCNPYAGRTAAMVTITGGRGPGVTGGPADEREGPIPYREPGSRKPEDAFAVLIKAGANPNARAPDGSTLLHQAVQAGNLDMIRSLADAGVDFGQPNRDGFTALEVAEGKRSERGDAGGAGAAGRGVPAGAAAEDVAKLLRELMGLPPAPGLLAAQREESTAPAARAGGAQ